MKKQSKTELITDAIQDYPEAGAGNCLKCVSWRYDEMKFVFFDQETGKRHALSMRDFRRGFNALIKQTNAGEFFCCGQKPDLTNNQNWDACISDAIVQCAIFGKVIYG